MPVAAAGLTVAASPTPAAAAITPCAGADVYAQHTVTPANATGGAVVSGAKFGNAVATGDFNHDGFADVVVGAPNDAVSGVAGGTISIFMGSASGIGTGVRFTQSNFGGGNEAADQFGASLATGDFNRDGFADLAAGVPGEAVGSTKSGIIAVWRGSSSGLTGGTWFDQTDVGGSNEADDRFGTALAAGDFNGDGFADLAVGAPGEVPPGTTAKSGMVFVFKGSGSGLVSGWWVTESDGAGTDENGDQFGAALAAGNVTGSSHADLVVGAPGEGAGGQPATSGAFFVVPGASSGKSAGFHRAQGDGSTGESGDRMGAALAVGDFDKDGYADVAAGVPGEAPGSLPAAGVVMVYPGASSGLATPYGLDESNGAETLTSGDQFGGAMAAGDANNDGYAELIVGARGKTYGTATAAGAAFLFQGRPRESTSTRSLYAGFRITQPDVAGVNESSDGFGAAVAIGDITGDGRGDGVIGAPGEAPPGQAASGTVTALSRLARSPASSAVEQFSPMAAMQASPLPGASLGTVEYAYSDNIGRLLHGHQTDPDSTLSVQWTAIQDTEAYTGKPALTEIADGRLQVTARSVTGDLWVRTEQTKQPPAWGAWANAGGPMASGAAVARQGDGRLIVFAVDAEGALWALPENGVNGPYTSWVALGIGSLAGTPVAVPLSSGIRLFVRDTAGVVRTALYSSGQVSGCTGVGDAPMTAAPSVVVYPGSILQLFAQAADGTIVTNRQDSSGVFAATWSPVATFTAAGPPSAQLDPGSGITHVIARGSDGGIYGTVETFQGSGVWQDWARRNSDLDPAAASDPTLFPYANSNGSTLAFVFRLVNDPPRIYILNNTAIAAADAGTSTGYSGSSLPDPQPVGTR